MARKKITKFVDRLFMGKEKSEDYARNSLPSNRWELFWDIFKGRFSKLVIVNLIMLVFFLPLLALILYRFMALVSYGANYPFAQGFGVGYMAPSSLVGFSETIVFQVDLISYLGLPIAALIAAFGIAGGAYVMRNMVWTEGIFVANDFLRGIKQNIKQVLLIALTFSMVFYITTVAISFSRQCIAAGSPISWLYTIIMIFSYIILFMYAIISLHMITMSVTYDLTFMKMLRNATLFSVSFLPHNIFFIFMGLIPYFIMQFGSFFLIVGLIMIILFGFSLITLIWTNYSQWIFDKYMNDKIPGAKKNRGIYEKTSGNAPASLQKYREQLALASRNSLNSRPIKPITDDDLKVMELPVMFDRNDLEKLRESKQAIYNDHARYVEEHKNDEQFKPTEEELAKKEKDQEKQKRIEKAKKALAKRKK